MKRSVWYILAVVSILFGCGRRSSSPREVQKFTSDWRFWLGDSAVFSSAAFDDGDWRTLTLPHDWSIEGSFSPDHPAGVGGGALPGGIGWYRKTFKVLPADSGKCFFIDFDGIYMNSEVWINDHYLGKRPNGYIGFRYDLTPYLHFDDRENVIAVRVDNSAQPNSRWYSGSGIYRNVWLTKVDPLHVDHWGTFVTCEVGDDRAKVTIENTIRNSSETDVDFHIEVELLDRHDKKAGNIRSDEVTVKAGKSKTVTLRTEVGHPDRWSTQDPALYKAVTKVFEGKELKDRHETVFGIRSFHFSSDKGFFLNGQPLKINGVCLHHDLGALGAAVNYRAIERQVEIMKGMGVNAIRTSHNPPAPELLQICDRMGLIVMDEAFDMWAKRKTTYDYSLYWDEWHRRDLQDLILRDRNHPSVMIWSIGNEIPEQHDTTGVAIARELVSIVHELDTTRPITTGNDHPYPHNYIIQSGALDLIGFNYHHHDWANFPETFPGENFIATETVSALATRGHYDMPSDSVRVWPKRWDIPFHEGNPDNTCSAYDNCRTPWGSTHAESWKLIKKYDFLSGMFIWTGFDYLGEPTPYRWPSRSSYFGIVDLAGFPKDIYYMYKSEWTGDTVLHIFPHWNWKEGDTVDVWAYYNRADEVELFLNGQSLGSKSKQGDELHVMWRVSFEPGTLRAESRKNGTLVAVKEIKTAGEPAKLNAYADRQTIHAGGEDLSFITVDVTDKDGNVVPYADNSIKITIEGDASIAGVDNGCQTSHHSFQADEIDAFNGKCLVIVRSGKTKGKARVVLESDRLLGSTVELKID